MVMLDITVGLMGDLRSLGVKNLEESEAIRPLAKTGKTYELNRITFTMDDFFCTIAVFLETIACTCRQPILQEKPLPEDYQKINDLSVVTAPGKHVIKYNEKTGNYEYEFYVEISSKKYPVFPVLQYAFLSAKKGYEIVTCPDMGMAYTKIAQFKG